MKQRSYFTYCCNVFLEIQSKEPFAVHCPKCLQSKDVKEISFNEGKIKVNIQKEK